MKERFQQFMSEQGGGAFTLKIFISVWALLVIILAWSLDSPWLLAGILAYEVLP